MNPGSSTVVRGTAGTTFDDAKYRSLASLAMTKKRFSDDKKERIPMNKMAADCDD
jgi:hypothetical protein